MPKENTNKSPKYKDIISSSVRIRSGPPVLYQLTANKQEFDSLTKMTVGKKNPNKANKTILLVGETGAGKSKLVDALFNYTMGVKWEDQVWFQIAEEEVKRSQTQSQTSDVIMYEIFGFEDKTMPYSLTIIDTPGYGDTRGAERDDIVSQKLFDLFLSEDGVHEISAVGLVTKASENRLNDRLMYVFDSMMSLFGKDLEKNIVALITHSDGRKPKNALQALEAASIKCAKNEKNHPIYFLFNNCQHEERIEEEKFLKQADETSEEGMREFVKFLKKSEPQNLQKTKNVLNERIRLTACIQNLEERIRMIELKQTEIKQIHEGLKKADEEMERHVNFIVEVDEPYKEKVRVKGKMSVLFYRAATSCKVCEETCHNPCKRALNASKCKLLKEGHCFVCTSKCPASDHVKEDWKYVIKTRKVQKTLEDVKNKYDKINLERGNKLSVLENLEKELNQQTAEKLKLLDESYEHVVKLEQIALKANSASIFVHLEFLIEKIKEKKDTEKVQKLEEMRSRVDEGTRVAAQYMKAALEKQNSNKSSKYKNIISNSVQISSGPPVLYQLTAKKQEFETLAKMTVGEKNPNKANKTILLVGETGAGKSKLVDALFNYTMGVKWGDEVWFQIAEEEKKRQTESQTPDVIMYEIFGFEDETLPYSLTIINTPGYGKNKGIKDDEIARQTLLDLFQSEDGIHEVHAVGLVMKASDNRLSDRLMYNLNSMMSLFGNDLGEKIVALITHSDGRKPKNALQALEAASTKCAKNEKSEAIYFLFNNCQHEERTEEETFLKQADEISEEGMREFVKFLKKSAEPQKLYVTVNVLEKRIGLTKNIKEIEIKQTEIKKIHEDIKKLEEEEKKNNEELTAGVGEDCKDKDDRNRNRRYPAPLRAVLKNIEKLKGGKKSGEETKGKEENKTVSENKLSLEKLENEMKKLTAEKLKFLDKCYEHVVELEQIALKADSVSTVVHLDFLIEKMKERGDTEKVQKLEEMRSRVDEGTRVALRYKEYLGKHEKKKP